MPIPSPSKGESQDKYIARCVRAMAKYDSDRPRKQQIAICFTKWRSKKK